MSSARLKKQTRSRDFIWHCSANWSPMPTSLVWITEGVCRSRPRFELWRPRCPANEALRMCLPCFKKNRLPGFPSLNNSAKVNVFRGQQRNADLVKANGKEIISVLYYPPPEDGEGGSEE